jgi:hypothetical protein
MASGAIARPVKKPDPPPHPAADRQQDPMEIENGAGPPQPPPTGPAATGPTAGSGGSGRSASPTSGGGATAGESGQPAGPSGRVMANLKLGPAFCALNCKHQGAAVIELGAAVLKNRSLYFIIPLQFQFATADPTQPTPVGNAAVLVPLGVQYDLAVSWLPGLYFYPRLSLGYALLLDNSGSGPPTTNAGVLIPELGIKYIYRGRWNFGGELFSMPVIFGRSAAGSFASLSLRILPSVGVNF